MALTIVTDEKLIKAAIDAIPVAFEKSGSEKVDRKVKLRRRLITAKVRMSTKYDLFVIQGRYKKKISTKVILGFGTRSINGTNLEVTCPITMPVSGLNRNLGGAFAQDEAGKLFLVHRGKIGGDGEGLGSDEFWDNYHHDKQTVNDGERKTEVTVIGELDSTNFVSDLATFVSAVKASMGRNAESGQPIGTVGKAEPRFRFRSFSPEFVGKRDNPEREHAEVDVVHGEIVNCLNALLSTLGHRTGNDGQRDLYIGLKGKVKALFEIKPKVTTSSLYSAVGQLTLNSIGLPGKPRLVFVAPHHIDLSTEKKLGKIGIDVLRFRLGDGVADFPDLSKWEF